MIPTFQIGGLGNSIAAISGGGGGGGSYTGETLAYITAVSAAGGSLTTGQKTKIDNFLIALQAKTYNADVLLVYPFIGSDVNTQIVPCRNSISAPNLTNIGFVNGDCSDAGINNVARAAKFLNTGLLPQNINSHAFAMGIGLASLTLDPTGNYVEPMGCYDSTSGTGSRRGVIDLRTTLRAFRMGDNANAASNASSAGSGRWAGERASNVSRKLYLAGSSVASNTSNDSGFNSGNTRTIHVMSSMDHAGNRYQIQAIGQYAFISKPLGDTNQADFDSLLNTYLVTPFGK